MRLCAGERPPGIGVIRVGKDDALLGKKADKIHKGIDDLVNILIIIQMIVVNIV